MNLVPSLLKVESTLPDAKEPSESRRCSMLLALAWILTESQWTFATGGATLATLLWVVILALAIAFSGFLGTGVLRFAGVRTPHTDLLLLPLFLATMRPAMAPRRALELGWGPLRIGTALLLVSLVVSWMRDAPAPRFYRSLVGR